jgi:CheY-like chemotaxis protein
MAIKLLLADDSITIHKVVSLTFADEDVQIDAVTNGNVAIEKARGSKPDIILADVFMPGRNGYEVCDAVKSDPELTDTPVVLLVGTFEPFDAEEAARVRSDAHLTKPFDTAELIHLVRNLVGRGEQQAEESPATTPSQAAELNAAARSSAEAQIASLISPRTRESFLGDQRILDIFDFPASPTAPLAEPAASAELTQAAPGHDSPHAGPVIPFLGSAKNAAAAHPPVALSPETIDQIVEKVVQRMSDNIVRDIAWEVVPALSEIMIRQYLDELRAGNKS